MTSRWISGALALTLVGAPGWAGDHAQHRDGSRGSSSSSASSAGQRHHSGGGAVRRDGGSSSSRSSAENRHPRAGTGSGWRHDRGHRHYSYYGRPYYYGYYGYGYPYYGYGYWDYGYWNSGYWTVPYPYRAPYYRYSRTAQVRVLVDPNETRVYVDGYYAGEADDFDGIFQRLDVTPGRHEIKLVLEGYKTQRFKVYVGADRTLKLHHDMVKGEGEVVADLRGPDAVDDDEDVALDREPAAGDDREDVAEDRDGELQLSLVPKDASVYVDGQYFGTGREARSIELTAGKHRIEVVRPGYRTEEREVDVKAGEATELAIDLQPGRL